MDQPWRLAYDVGAEGITSKMWSAVGLYASGVIILPLLYIVASRRHKDQPSLLILLVAWLGWTTLGGLGCGNVLSQRWRCMKWLETGDYSIVEGKVTNFIPMPRQGHANETLHVNGIKFEYSDFDLSKGGFNNAASRGGPIRDGLYVKLCYRDGRILRIEILKE